MIGLRPTLTTRAQRLADTIIEERRLTPPIPIEDLVREVADIRGARLRETGLDAVLHGLHRTNRPTLLIDEDAPDTRRRFTLAHEYGHLSMAWHRGTLRCHINAPVQAEQGDETTTQVFTFERDADQFASRLLIPRGYIEELDPRDVDAIIDAAFKTGVSAEAAIYGITSYLPPGNLLILLDSYGTHIHRLSTSEGTVNLALRRGEKLDEGYLDRFLEASGHRRYGGAHMFWGRTVPDMKLTTAATDWRSFLTRILEDAHLDPTPSGPIWRSVNGVASAAHSDVGHDNVEASAQRIKHVFQRNETYHNLPHHPLFDDYASSRALAFALPKRAKRPKVK